MNTYIVYYSIVLSLLCYLAWKAPHCAIRLRGYMRSRRKLVYDNGQCYVMTLTSYKKYAEDSTGSIKPDPLDHSRYFKRHSMAKPTSFFRLIQSIAEEIIS